MLYVVVAADGTVQHACAAERLGDGLEERAVEMVRNWKFEPATLNGKPKPVQIMVGVDFHLYKNDQGAIPGKTKAKDPQ